MWGNVAGLDTISKVKTGLFGAKHAITRIT
jgi:hypothetical protein